MTGCTEMCVYFYDVFIQETKLFCILERSNLKTINFYLLNGCVFQMFKLLFLTIPLRSSTNKALIISPAGFV